MRSLPISQIFLTTFAACILAACGGGDGAAMSDADGYTVESGLAQKGPLSQGSAIWINELAVSTYNQNGKGYTFRTTNNLGAFDPSGYKFGTPYLNTVAQGYYFNEITGTQADDMVLLSGLSQIGKVGTVAADTAINVNVLSSMAVNRTLKLAQTKPAVTFAVFAVARARAQKEVLAAFNIYNGAALFTGATAGGVTQPANLTALDLSKSRAGDQLLAAISAVVMQAGSNGAGVNALLAQAANDLADDGLLNNSTRYTTSVQSQLCAAAATTDFARVATNLNTLYGTNYSATDLSQWVDTSGCVDQVINKYKFSASNVSLAMVSQSPAYVAGPDDVGQCFSVGAVTAGATAGLYYNGAATPVAGTQVAKLGDSLTIGLSASNAGNYSGFIERSAPGADGACSTQPSQPASTKVLKYSISAVPNNYVPQAYIVVNYDNGTGFRTVYTNSLPVGNQSRTYVAWVKTTATSSASSILSYAPLNCLGNENLHIGSDGTITITTNCADIKSTKSISDNNWHLVVVTYSGGAIDSTTKIYIDGVMDTVKALSFLVSYQRNTTSTNALYLGGGDPYAGTWTRGEYYLSGVQVWTRALIDAEIMGIYKTGLVTDQSNLVVNITN